MNAALAIFVKTPGVSPLKTRLAAATGPATAQRFYRLAAAAVASVTQQLAAEIESRWAVAEPAGLAVPDWLALPALAQGSGELGQRLHRIYRELLAQFERVLLIGADTPQLTVDLLRRALCALDENPFALARAMDGGFWLFAGRRPIPEGLWRSVAYSQPDTAAQLAAALSTHGAVAELPVLADVDTASDLAALADALTRLPMMTTEQRALLDWLRTQPRLET